MPENPWRVGANSISLQIKEPLKDAQGNVKLSSLISKENLDLFLHKAKEETDYAKAKEKFEFRVKQLNGQVFIELKKRDPGFFGKIFAFIGSGRRIAERNDAMFALAKFSGLGLSDINRLAGSRTAYLSTKRSDARQFQQRLVRAREKAASTSISNRGLWSLFSPVERQEMLSVAATRNGMNSFIDDVDKEIVFNKAFFALDSVEDRELTRDEAKVIAEKALDRHWAQQKQKIELLKEMGLTGMTIDQQYDLEKQLIKGPSMDASYFAAAKTDASVFASGIKRLASIPVAESGQRRMIAIELMTQLKNAAQARGMNGLQEFGDLAPLVAYAAKGNPENGLDEIDNLRETLDFLSELCLDITMNDDSPDYVNVAIPAAQLARVTEHMKEYF